MRIAYITAGAAGMFCGSCLHDNTLASAMQRKGHDIALVPTYTPVRTDEDDVSIDRVFYGAVNVYLEQRYRVFRRTPEFLHWLLDRPTLLNWVGKLAGSAATQGEELGALTLSVLQGEDGNQRGELDRLVKWLRDDYRPEIVHITNSMLLGMARTIRRELDVPVLCNVQGEDIFLDELAEPYRTRVHDEIRAHARDVDAFIAPSKYYAEYMANYLGVSADRMRVIRLGITLDGHTAAQRTDDMPFTVGFLARQCPEKGVHRLVDAFLELHARNPQRPLALRVAGYRAKRDENYVREQRARLTDAGLDAQVEWTGEVDRDGKMRFLEGLDVFCMPTVYRESKGLPVLEALASGVPAVLPAHGNFPEMMEWTGGGITVEPDSTAALTTGLEAMLNDPAARREFGRHGREAVHRELSDESMAQATLREYERWRSTN